jgi:signal peptidase II
MFCIVALGLLIADQISKAAIMDGMVRGQSLDLPGGFLQLTYIHNSGGAFGLFPQGGPLFLITGVLVTAGMVWALPRLELWGHWTASACALILGGTLGNLVDRVRFGSVVDFLDLGWWPIFNVADMGISVGIGLLLLQMILAPSEPAASSPNLGPEQDGASDSPENLTAEVAPESTRADFGAEPEG